VSTHTDDDAAGGGAVVGVVMGSDSDWPVMEAAVVVLEELGVACEVDVVSAHRMPEEMVEYGRSAESRGLRVIVAGAGGAAHLPGMAASMTPLPVFGVPMNTHALEGKDSLLSIMQMPAGIPVGTLAIGKPGATNAALLAAAVLALSDAKIAKRLDAWRARQTKSVAKRPKD
jgi:5-(carboxyamino)imidazole ribonucleotide mutase